MYTRLLLATLASLSTLVTVALGDTAFVSEARVKVFLFAQPAFYSQVAVDAYKDACISLDNNLIDGLVQSFLVGGYNAQTVLSRTDNWYCVFYDNYDCSGDENTMLKFSDGVNNLASSGWGGRIKSLKCHIDDSGDD